MISVISKFNEFALQNKCNILVAFLPQKDDIIYIKSHSHFYQSVLDKLNRDTLTVDLAADFLKINSLDEYYSDDSKYGGHYSAIGNELVAQSLFRTLKNHQYIS